ncbi:MAG: hypothetical protein ACREOK_00395 [Gemmatimonadaceae bacterium]
MSRRVAPFVIAVVVSLVTACDSTEPRGPGSIFITSSTEAPEPGSSFFQYEIIVDNGSPRMANVFETVAFQVNGLAPGDHQVRLGAIPAICDAGENPRTVNVRGDDTTLVVFSIECQRVTGDLRVNVTTTGPDQDLDGYVLFLGNFTGALLPSNGQVTLPFIAAGTHTISLTDLASNCTYGGAQNVTITAGQLATVNFAITCAPVAVLKVVAATTGEDPDIDGYAITTGGAMSATRVPTNGTTYVRANTGTVNWQLTDIQPNCSIAGSTSGSATVAPGDTLTIDASATCTSIGYGTAGTSATDAAADTLGNSMNNANPAHDLVQMSARYAPGFLILVARFSKPVGSVGTGAGGLYVVMDFDVDENASTGANPIINQFGGSANQGSDNRILLDEGVAHLLTAEFTDTLSHAVPVVMEADSVLFKIPLEKLGNDDGSLSATVVLGTFDRPTDIAPNSGVFLARPSASLLADGNAVSVTGGISAFLTKGAGQWPPAKARFRKE